MLKMIRKKDLSLVVFFLTFYAVVQAPFREGDVILGGISPIHLRGTSEDKCGEFFPPALAEALAMIYAIEQINNDSKLLPNITLGYDIRDYCESISKATQITYDLIKDKCSTNTTKGKGKKSVVALIGPAESHSAVVIAGLLQTLNASGITPSATSAELRSHAYKHLFRMLPSDNFRAKAMADIIERFKWSYVAAVGQDDSFGRNGMWSLIKEAATRNSFCVALTEFIPNEGRLLSQHYVETIILESLSCGYTAALKGTFSVKSADKTSPGESGYWATHSIHCQRQAFSPLSMDPSHSNLKISPT